MRQRISELETTLSQIVQRLKDLDLDVDEVLRDIDLEAGSAIVSKQDQQRQSLDHITFSRISISDDLDAGVEQTPFFSFFESNVLGFEKADRDTTSSTTNSDTRFSFVRDKYRALIKRLETIAPSRQLVDAIVQESCLTLGLLRSSFADLQCMFSGSTDESGLQSVRSWILESFDSKEPARVCKALILLAACIQQLPPGHQVGHLRLRTPLDILQKQYMNAADAFLAPDDGILSTVDGLECLISQVTFYLHAGLPRRSWVLFRRATTFAQLLAPSLTGSDTRLLGIWMQLWQIDKSLSLLLGLPYMLTPSNVPLDARSLPPQARFAFNLGKIGARVIDRNLAGRQNMVFSDTIELDRDLSECKNLMAVHFWNPPPTHGTPVEARFAANTVHFWCQSLRNLIHLPFVLKKDGHVQYEFSEQAALESSTEMLRIYKLLRDPSRPVLRQCDMLDFQAMTAGLVVIYLLLEGSMRFDATQVEQNWQMIYEVVSLMENVGQCMPDSVAAQAALLLHDVAGVRDGSSEREDSFVALPYFGRLCIRSGPRADTGPKEEDDAKDAATSFLTFDDFAFYDSMELVERDWTSINFSLLDDWQWGNEQGDL